MNAITRATLVTRRQDLLATDMGGETVMMSIEHGHYYGLNRVGSRTWELLRQTVSVDDICRQVEAEYAVSSVECERAILSFLDELADHGLISVS